MLESLCEIEINSEQFLCFSSKYGVLAVFRRVLLTITCRLSGIFNFFFMKLSSRITGEVLLPKLVTFHFCSCFCAADNNISRSVRWSQQAYERLRTPIDGERYRDHDWASGCRSDSHKVIIFHLA